MDYEKNYFQTIFYIWGELSNTISDRKWTEIKEGIKRELESNWGNQEFVKIKEVQSIYHLLHTSSNNSKFEASNQISRSTCRRILTEDLKYSYKRWSTVPFKL